MEPALCRISRRARGRGERGVAAGRDQAARTSRASPARVPGFRKPAGLSLVERRGRERGTVQVPAQPWQGRLLIPVSMNVAAGACQGALAVT
jgi:hypothetical protein